MKGKIYNIKVLDLGAFSAVLVLRVTWELESSWMVVERLTSLCQLWTEVNTCLLLSVVTWLARMPLHIALLNQTQAI